MKNRCDASPLSVVIPTHLPRGLDRTLGGLGRQTVSGFEVIVVENGARSNEVVALCERWRNQLDLHWTFDPRPGLNRARNTGAGMASGRYVALLDDDCEPSERWVESVLEAWNEFPEAAAIGGPIRLEFESPPPDWLIGEFRTCLSEMQRGDSARVLAEGEFLFGANMAFSKAVHEAAGGFPEAIGMNSRRPPQLSNDEIAFLENAARASSTGMVYQPDMNVTHIIPASRVSLQHMFQRRLGQGLSDVALMRWRYGPTSDRTVSRYLNGVFPHPWHFRQLEERMRMLSPETAERYLYSHVVCRTGYLWGYRKALSGSVDAGETIENAERLVPETGCPDAGAERRSVASRMVELMYGAGADEPGERSTHRADDRLGRLVDMARSLEPGLFKTLLTA